MNNTLMDIAARSGVSTSTVSRVLSNSSHAVAEKTRQKVLQAAEELNYTPNAFARGLSKGEFRFVGLVVSDIRDPYFVEMARGVEDEASLRDYLVVYCNTDRETEKERRYLEQLSALRAGVILAGGAFRKEAIARGLANHPAPVVTVGTYQLGCASVRIDNVGGSLAAVDHLSAAGPPEHRLPGRPVQLHGGDRAAGRVPGCHGPPWASGPRGAGGGERLHPGGGIRQPERPAGVPRATYRPAGRQRPDGPGGDPGGEGPGDPGA